MKKIVTVLFLYSGDDWEKSAPFLQTPFQDNGYRNFYTRGLNEFGILCVRASIDWYQNGVWQKYWTFDGEQWVKHDESIRPDIVVDKSGLYFPSYQKLQDMQQHVVLLNAWELKMIASDKLITSVVFQDLMPQSKLVYTTDQLIQAITGMESADIVIKPQHGFGGNGIVILPAEEAKQVEIHEPCIVQPFIDTSGGIHGIVQGYHDLRVVVMGDNPAYSFVRTPAPGSKLCNLAQGGSALYVPLADVPSAVMDLITRVRRQLQTFPHSIYSVDFLFDEHQKPWIVEMNATTGLDYRDESPELKQFGYDAHFRYFLSLVK